MIARICGGIRCLKGKRFFCRISVITDILFHLRNSHIKRRGIFNELTHNLHALQLAHIAKIILKGFSHQTIPAGIIGIRITVIMRAGIGITEAKQLLPLHFRGIFCCSHIQRCSVIRLIYRNRAIIIFISQMEQTVSQFMPLGKRRICVSR